MGARLERAVASPAWHSNVYGLARTSLALGTLGTLLFSHSSTIFRPVAGAPDFPTCIGVLGKGLFCLAGASHLEAARWLAVALLALVALGYRPRVTGILHWYVCWSLFTSGVLVDGGDQISSILALLLVPVTLTDGRRWHWDPPSADAIGADATSPLRLFARSCLFMIRLQFAAIYFQAAVAKMRVPEWRDGTAVYYWFTDPGFGFYEPILHWAVRLMSNGAVVSLLTYSAMTVEIFLFAGLIAQPLPRRILLMCGIAFHAAIAIVHGLPSFAFPMWAGLILYLHPIDVPFPWLDRAWTAIRRHVAAARTTTAALPTDEVAGQGGMAPSL